MEVQFVKKYRNTIEFEVEGPYALFSDPVMRVGGEKTSYHIPTYEGLKGIVESIYWKPTIIWIIDAVRIMNLIQTETKGIRPIAYNGGNELAYYTYLKDVRYQVRAHFEMNLNQINLEGDRNENKHHNIAKRMVQRGGRRDVFLGTRECQAFVEPCVFGEGESYYDTMDGEVGYGYMYHGITYAEEAVLEEDKNKMTVRFWKPVMKKGGIIEFIRPEDCTQKRVIREMDPKIFEDGKNFTGLEEFTSEEVGE
ncbi:MAG: type I-C CRISPR-associated protein Cas5c [Lachnospiraceae bacterium]|nr:type I-C CRISPR-associated protein Cas5c [Lachnospiraceae bacterium]